MNKLIQFATVTLMLTAAACTNSTRESTGTTDTDARGGSNTRAADPSPSPGASGGTNAGTTTGGANGAMSNGSGAAGNSGAASGSGTTSGSH
jgi:hypothetical protein